MKTYYDSSTTLGNLTGPGDATSTTSLKTASTATWAASAKKTYDAYGRALTATSPLGRKTTTDYGTGTAAKYLPSTITTTNAETANGTTDTWSSNVTLDIARQLPLTSTDINGRVTSTTYDGLGRLTQVWLPNHKKATYPSSPSMQYSYVVQNNAFVTITSSTLTDANTHNTTVAIYDALLQQRQTQATPRTGENGTRLITDSGYDTHGWQVVADAEFYNTDSGPTSTPVSVAPGQIHSQTVTVYDGRGRSVADKFFSDGTLEWSSTTDYSGEDQVRATPPSGGIPTLTTVDVRGQKVEVDTDPGGPNANSTYYDYDALGRQTSVTGPLRPSANPDTSNLTWTSQYDALGNVTHTTDPDVGTTTNTYDDASNLTETVSTGNEAGATTTTLTYEHSVDPFDRLTAVYSGSTNPVKLSSYTYDPGGQSGTSKGQLASETQYASDGTTATYTKTISGYNANYQPLIVTQTVKAGAYGNTSDITYSENNAYTPVQGNLDTSVTNDNALSNTSNEAYGFAYNGYGLPLASGGNSTYESDTVYDPWGQVVRATMGLMPNQVVATNSWDEPTQRLRNTTVSKQNGTTPVNVIDYTYNAVGTITSISDLQGGGPGAQTTDTQCFTYDSLNRLTTAWTSTEGTSGNQSVGARGACSDATPSAATVGGPAPYWETYGYNLAGNRTDFSATTVSGSGASATASTVSTSETYDGTTTAGPHALHTATIGTGATAPITTDSYDGGRLIKSTTATNNSVDTSKTRTLTWTPTGEIASVTVGDTSSSTKTTYGYSPDGDQIAQTNTLADGSASTTLTLGRDTITIPTTGSSAGTATEVDRQYPFPGGLTAVRVSTQTPTGPATAVHYQGSDQHGTATTDITADSTLTLSRHAYTPFGELRSTQSTPLWAGTRGFLNATSDATTGLTTLGARQYDPAFGAFISVDPEMDAADPQSINGYAYADNNPVNGSDPTGTVCLQDTAALGMGGGHTTCGTPDTTISPGEATGAGSGAGSSSGSTGSGGGSGSSGGGGSSSPPLVAVTPHIFVQGLTGKAAALKEMFDSTYNVSSWKSYNKMADDQQVIGIAEMWYDACKEHKDICAPSLTSNFWWLKQAGESGASLRNKYLVIGDNAEGELGFVGMATDEATPAATDAEQNGPAAESEISDSTVIVRGGQSDLPPRFSGSQGRTLEEAAQGVPHGTIRSTTAGEIRESGGTVEPNPEFNENVGRINYQHVDVCLGDGSCPFGEPQPNPVPKSERFGGPNYPYAVWEP